MTRTLIALTASLLFATGAHAGQRTSGLDRAARAPVSQSADDRIDEHKDHADEDCDEGDDAARPERDRPTGERPERGERPEAGHPDMDGEWANKGEFMQDMIDQGLRGEDLARAYREQEASRKGVEDSKQSGQRARSAASKAQSDARGQDSQQGRKGRK